MKRWTVGLSSLSVVLVLFTAGCGDPSGTDGDLLDEWAAMAAPGVPVPSVGECWNFTGRADKIAVGADLVKVECDKPHASETIHVGEFTGGEASASTPPAPAGLADAYTVCDQKAKAFLGGDWHDARVSLAVLPPSDKQWKGDARYYRCDLIEVSNDTHTVAPRSSTLKDGLSGSQPLGIGCVEVKVDSAKYIEDFVPVKCDKIHNGEYTGTFYSPDARPYPTDVAARRALLQPGCKAVVAAFLGVTVAQFDTNTQVTFAWSTAQQTRWSYGDRSARCYLMLEGTLSVSRTLKGNGNNPV